MNIEQLIAALEKATGPSRELDLAIWNKLYPDAVVAELPKSHFRVTASLDAALTLLLPGWAWCVQASEEFPGQAWLYPPNNVNDEQVYAKAATPAIAICIAALKARKK